MTMPTRFQRSRWSETRREIDRMAVGESLTFPIAEYFNCKSSVDRMNDAYDGQRQWKLTNRTTVSRIK